MQTMVDWFFRIISSTQERRSRIINDEEWKGQLYRNQLPRPDEWTIDYLVPAEGGIPIFE